ncbi:MAG: rhodanese-like domain-containing protein [Opitutaceae bacterium]
MSQKTISPHELPQLFVNQSTVIDVRTPGEFNAAHVNGAQLQPLDQLDAASFCQTYGTENPVYVLCQSGKRACMAADKLIGAGHQNVIVVEGGTAAAIEHGLDINYGKGAISIERQVRITAGSLAFLGTILGLFVHAGFFGIPAFVGAGLVFAGVTDTCGMSMILSKFPWNR